ncbi:MAG: hypothetical protein ACRC80_38530 [Waterburya sp.]
MKAKYIVLSEYVNLNGIIENSKELYANWRDGDDKSHQKLLPNYMFSRGQEIEIDLATLSETGLATLASLEGCFALVRLNTDYNAQAKKQGLEVDLYKIQIGTETKFYNSVKPQAVMNSFCQNWEEKKAYILNPVHARWFLPLIDSFYGSIKRETIKTNK